MGRGEGRSHVGRGVAEPGVVERAEGRPEVGRRRLLVPEVLQTSALDCGPAALASLLSGCGRERPLERLREACRTGRDGTSIDALEAVATAEGLGVEQVLVPVESALLAAAACVPCLLVVARPGGAAHFVVVWRRHGRRVEVMDPAVGRRWPLAAEVEREIWRHRAVVPAAAWAEWAASAGGRRPLVARLAALGVAETEAEELVRWAAGAGGWRPLAALDAAVRFGRAVVAAGGVRRGREAGRLVRALVERAAAPRRGSATLPPERFWSVRPAGRERVECEGAVLVRVMGVAENKERGGCEAHGCDVSGIGRRWARGWCRRGAADGGWLGAWGLGRAGGAGGAVMVGATGGAVDVAVLVGAVGGAALGRFVEGAGLVAVVEAMAAAPSAGLWRGGLAALAVLGAAQLGLEMAADGGARSLGRRREARLRLGLAAKVPRLEERYVRTRLAADLAERAHRIAELRRGPEMAAGALGAGCEVVLAAAGIGWLDPALATGAWVTALGAVAVPLLLMPRCEERSRRVGAHGAAMGGLYLDALRGLGAVRAHGAAAAIRCRHEEVLAGWLRARRAAATAGAWLEGGTQGLLSLAVAGLVMGHVRRHGVDGRALVVALWGLALAAAGQRLAGLVGRGLARDRSLWRRMAEMLTAPEEAAEGAAAEEAAAGEPPAAVAEVAATAESRLEEAEAVAREGRGPAEIGDAGGVETGRGMAIRWQGCSVESGGRSVLREVDVAIGAGQHVAVVGASGAGKSTLLGTVLGWHRLANGRLQVDGRPMDAARLAELRRETAWVAPEVALWRGPLLGNLGGGRCCGRPDASAAEAGLGSGMAELAPVETLRAAQLLELVAELAGGLQEPLGEGGGRLSGGEAQRLRLARALRRPRVRLALLDEACRGLGADRRAELLAAARTRWREATVLCVTHSPGEAAGFDRVLVLEDGRVVEDGAPEQLAARPGSRFGAMLAAEARAAAAMAGPGWRRLRLAGGRIEEMPAGEGAAAEAAEGGHGSRAGDEEGAAAPGTANGAEATWGAPPVRPPGGAARVRAGEKSGGLGGQLEGMVWRADEEVAALVAAAAALGDRTAWGWSGGGAAGGVGVDAIEVPWEALRRALPVLGPAVVRLPAPAAGCLAVARGGWRRLVVVGPDGRRCRVGTSRLVAMLAEKPAAGDPAEVAEVDGLLAEMGLAGRRRRSVGRALVRARLAAGPGVAVRVGSPAAEVGRGAEVWTRRLAPAAAALVVAIAVWQALSLAGWFVLGRGVLAGELGQAWLLAWALLLPTLALVQAGEAAAAGALAHRAARLGRLRLLEALLAVGRERLRGEGTGRLLGRILAVESLERAVLAAGPAALLGAAEVTAAAAVLARGAGGGVAMALLAVAVAAAGCGAAAHARAQRTVVAAGLELTEGLVEELSGHRTRLAEGGGGIHGGGRGNGGCGDRRGGDGRSGDGVREDAAVAGNCAVTGRAGRWETWLRAGLPRMWMLAGLGAVAARAGVASNAGAARMAASAVGVAVLLGGVLLARAGLGRLGAALVEMSVGWSAAGQVRAVLGGDGARAGGGGIGAPEAVGVGGRAGTVAAVCEAGGVVARRFGVTGVAMVGGEAGVAGAGEMDERLIEVRGVECRLPGRGSLGRSLLSGVDLTIREGDRCLLEGPSGAGKSTLAAILAGQRQPESGMVLLGGLDWATLGSAAWRRRVVAVPQLHENHLFGETLAFNLLLGRGWPPGEGDVAAATAVCRELGLGPLLERLPSGLETRVGEAGWELSEGEASRVCVARALLQEPEMLILDESLAALDPESRVWVLAAVERRVRTLVVIAHGEALPIATVASLPPPLARYRAR
jgi:ABC-type bacteriocin/lantibiotic exporter with double-glycine peptidase domain